MTTGTGPQHHEVQTPRAETDAGCIARRSLEKAIIAKAEADIDAGLGVEDAVAEAWLNALDNDPDAPLPLQRSGRLLR